MAQGKRPRYTRDGYKICPDCGVEKPFELYHRHKTGWMGLASKCKECCCRLANDRTARGWTQESSHKNRQTIGGRAAQLKRSINARCKKDGVELSREWLIEQLQKPCAATGMKFCFSGEGGRGNNLRSPWSPSVDRIDPGGPYSEGNCRMVVLMYNQARSNWREEDVLVMAEELLVARACRMRIAA